MKRTKLRRKGKSRTSKLQKECDTLIQTLGKQRYKYCEVCGKPMSCLHHFHPKSVSNALRYDWQNLIPICNGCHARHHQANDPHIHGTIIQKRGQKWHETLLKRRWSEEVKTNVSYYLETLERLNNKLT